MLIGFGPQLCGTSEYKQYANFLERRTCELPRITLPETVWKLRIGSITWSYESTEQGKGHHFGRFALPKNARLHTSSDFPDSLSTHFGE
jgi:hypothetical protein